MDETMEKYRKVYNMLEDKESQDIYLNRLGWLVSGDYKYIKNIVVDYVPSLPLLDKTTTDLCNSMPRDKKVVLYGAGDVGRLLLLDWAHEERFIGFCCKTKEKQ